MNEYLGAEDWLVKYHWEEWNGWHKIWETLEDIERFATYLGWNKNYKNEKINNNKFNTDFSKYLLPGEREN